MIKPESIFNFESTYLLKVYLTLVEIQNKPTDLSAYPFESQTDSFHNTTNSKSPGLHDQ